VLGGEKFPLGEREVLDCFAADESVIKAGIMSELRLADAEPGTKAGPEHGSDSIVSSPVGVQPQWTGEASASARAVVPILLELVAPRSVVDVGCGPGVWLAAFTPGILDVLGIDGDYVNRDALLIPPEKFLARNLEHPVALDRRFDLALCLEVGEHLPAESSGTLVKTLTDLAPVVAFSAAIPGQGGVDHLTERWPNYWASLFAARGYRPLDLIRPRIWGDDRVESWYRQNLLLYADAGRFERLAAHTQPFPSDAPLVHPDLFTYVLQRERGTLTLRRVAHELPRAIRRAVAHRVRRARSRR
jgi:SAM-dependent methyltransferase